MMMVVRVMMAYGVRRNSQTTQDSQGYYSEKHATDIHETPFDSAVYLPNDLTSDAAYLF